MNKYHGSEEKSDPEDRAEVAIKGHLIQTFILQKAKLGLRENRITAVSGRIRTNVHLATATRPPPPDTAAG